MSRNKTDLYLYSSYEELIKKVGDEVDKLPRPNHAGTILKSCGPLQKEARRLFDMGDEEKAYLIYLKYATLCRDYKKARDYQSDPKYFDSMILTGLLEAVERCESLKKSLKDRFSLKKRAQETAAKEKEEERKREEEKQKEKTKAPQVNGIVKAEKREESEKEVTVHQLKNLVEQKSTRLLVIDCRGHHDFNSSHLNHPGCISIPQEALEPGMSAGKVEKKVKDKYPESFHAWNKRVDYDRVILYDWNSSWDNMQGSIRNLYEAMTQWDPATKYKSPPAILQGGFRNLYYTYPLLINHPQNTKTGLGVFEENGSASAKEIRSSLDSIQYPSFEPEEKPKPKEMTPPAPTNSCSNPSTNNNSIPPPPAQSVPDRSTKPSVTKIIPIQVTKENGPKVSKDPNPPLIPKPSSSSSSTISPIPSSPSLIPKIPSNSSSSSSTQVDRATKPKVVHIPIQVEDGHSLVNGVKKESPPPSQPPPPQPQKSNSPEPSNNKEKEKGSPLLRPVSQDAGSVSYHQKLRDEPGESPRGLLKRSHSHPNIAQSLSEEESGPAEPPSPHPQQPLPAFNRNLKPSGGSRPTDFVPTPTRARQFHAINSTEKHRTGLKNLGNTCYMNSIVQCLVHLPVLVEYFNGDGWSKYTAKNKQSRQCKTNGEISSEWHAVLQEICYGHRSIAIIDFKNIVGRYNSSFKGYEQQDSHEFMTILLDWLHEELNRNTKMTIKEQNNDGLTDSIAASKHWETFIMSNRSIITDLFYGQTRSAVRCMSCGKESVTFGTFSHLTVPIPITSRKVDIYQCIDLFTNEEVVSDYSCSHCNLTLTKATKKFQIWRLPPYLIIHLQRFYNDGWWKKRLTEVDFPVDNLDLTSRAPSRGLDGLPLRSTFFLQAISNHYGSMDGGHYTAYCRKQGSWAKFDDQEVTQISARDVVTPAAYILFYVNAHL